MAKIRKVALKVFGKHEEITLNYNAKRSKFDFKLPDSMHDFAKASETDLPSGNSEEAAMNALREFVELYETGTRTERKVIVYKTDWQSKRIDRHIRRRWGRAENEDAVLVEFEYKVLLELDVCGRKRYGTKRESPFARPGDPPEFYQDHDIDLDDWVVVEWTAKREKFMEDVYGSLELLIERLKSFAETPELLLAASAKGALGQGLLLEDRVTPDAGPKK